MKVVFKISKDSNKLTEKIQKLGRNAFKKDKLFF